MYFVQLRIAYLFDDTTDALGMNPVTKEIQPSTRLRQRNTARS
jgi:hydroxymethylglutaryl-CoA reductase